MTRLSMPGTTHILVPLTAPPLELVSAHGHAVWTRCHPQPGACPTPTRVNWSLPAHRPSVSCRPPPVPGTTSVSRPPYSHSLRRPARDRKRLCGSASRDRKWEHREAPWRRSWVPCCARCVYCLLWVGLSRSRGTFGCRASGGLSELPVSGTLVGVQGGLGLRAPPVTSRRPPISPRDPVSSPGPVLQVRRKLLLPPSSGGRCPFFRACPRHPHPV